MKITIDATGLSPFRTGTVTYLLEILARWAAVAVPLHQFVIFCTPQTRHHFEELQSDRRFTLALVSRNKLMQMLWQQTFLPLYLWRHKIDVHWGPGFILPLVKVCPMAVTIHDMTFESLPEVHEPIKRVYFPFMIRRALGRADMVFAVSRSTANDVQRLIPGGARRIAVTYLAPRTPVNDQVTKLQHKSVNRTLPISDSVTKPYVLFVGTLEPRKNLERLLAAWRELPVEVCDKYHLKVIGVKGWMVDQLEQQSNDTVEVLGHVSDAALDSYLSNATCFAYPSLYEGFGLPVIEAMAAGIPVLTSNVGATREIAEGAAVLVDPRSVDSIQAGLAKLLSEPDLRRELSEAGLNRAAQFSWAQTAQATWQALENIASPT